MKILVTSGGTKVPIDKVRDITNMSTGTFGSKIAYELMRLGHEIVFYRAKNSKSPMTLTIDLAKTGYNIGKFSTWYNEHAKLMPQYLEYEYSTFDQYADGLKFIIGVEKPDVIVLAAAVSDYGVENYVDGKMRSNDLFNVKLKQLPKLINRVKEWSPNSKLVGFKLLVNSKEYDLIAAAKRSVDENNCDLVIANDLDDIKNNKHTLHLVSKAKDSTYIVKKHVHDPSVANDLAIVVANEIQKL